MRQLLVVSGILAFLLYVVGFSILFIVNPATFEELNNISLASYNIIGMDSRWAPVLLYASTGICNITFCICLFFLSKNDAVINIGKILLLISGIIWFSFAIIPYDPTTTNNSNHVLLLRVMAILFTIFLAFLFLGTQFELIIPDRFLKWFTLLCGFAIFILSMLGVLVFNDQTWVRTNVSFTIYFIWLGVVGLYSIFVKSESFQKR